MQKPSYYFAISNHPCVHYGVSHLRNGIEKATKMIQSLQGRKLAKSLGRNTLAEIPVAFSCLKAVM